MLHICNKNVWYIARHEQRFPDIYHIFFISIETYQTHFFLSKNAWGIQIWSQKCKFLKGNATLNFHNGGPIQILYKFRISRFGRHFCDFSQYSIFIYFWTNNHRGLYDHSFQSSLCALSIYVKIKILTFWWHILNFDWRCILFAFFAVWK